MANMLGMRKQFEVFNSVIKRVSVLVVNMFAFYYFSSKKALHNKTMLHNVSVRISVWMRRKKDLHIFSSPSFPSFPKRMFFSFLKFFRCFIKFCCTRSRTARIVYSYLGFKSFKCFFTAWTNINLFHGKDDIDYIVHCQGG